MTGSQHSKTADARKTKQQLIDELRKLRGQLAAALRKASGAHDESNEQVLQTKLDKLSDDYSLLPEIIEIETDAVISEIKRAEERNKRNVEELSHVSRVNMLGEISASFAHELNQPLTAILATAQTLQHQMTPTAAISVEMIESISDVIDDAKRAAEQIRRLRSLSERRKSHIEFVDINKLIAETETLLRSRLIMSGGHVEMEFDHALPRVSCDPIQMQQVFLNLLTNAIDATANRDPPDRHALIRTSCLKSNAVEITIRDNGTGFKNEPYRNLLNLAVPAV